MSDNNLPFLQDEALARERFLYNISQLGSSAVLIEQHKDGKYEALFVSPEYVEMMEDTEENTLRLMGGEYYKETTHPDDRYLVEYMLENHRSPEGGTNIQVRKITSKGHTIWCNIHYAFIDYLHTHFIYIVYSDITVLKGYEDKLAISYDSIKKSYYAEDEKTLAMFRVDLDYNVVKEVKGKDLFPEDEEESEYTTLLSKRCAHYPVKREQKVLTMVFSPENLTKAYLEGQEHIRHIFFTMRQNGEICFAEISANMTRHPINGRIVAFIHERECNNEKVSETLIHKILVQQFDMIAYLANSRYYVSVGDEALIQKGSIFPKSRVGDYAEYLETRVFPVLFGTEEEQEEMRMSLSTATVARELSKSDRYETNIVVNVGGETFYKRFVFYSVDSAARFCVLLKQDTTDQRREQIAQNEKLREALEEAERANEAKTIFLSNMSHDIRTPMNAIIGFTKLADGNDDPKQVQEFLKKIESSSQHLLALINDVLEMSRIESGKIEIDEVKANLCEMMDDVRDMFTTQMETKNIKYVVDYSGITDKFVYCDRFRLNRVLLNLVSNAYKFTPEDGTITVTLTQKDCSEEGKASYELHVKDSGIGMSEEFAEHVFEAFARERTSTVSGIQGTGLGMAITKSIIDLMQGTIEVVTAPNEGTDFIVNVCFQLQTDEDAAETGTVGQQGRDVEKIDFSGVKVLLTEDMDVNRELASFVLSEKGFIVEEAVNGKEAVDKIAASQAGDFDIVLMDIQMPIMNGYEAAKAIRSLDDEKLNSIPIIAMTANAFREDVEAALEAGMNGHVAKPLDIVQLLTAIAECLQGGGK